MKTVGVVGLGMMGLTHLDVYAKLADCRVTAIADRDPNRLAGKVKAAGNVEGQAQGGFDFHAPDLKKYDDGMAIIKDPSIDIVDICLPTPMHTEFAIAAMKAGKHVLIEKPLARTAADALLMVNAAAESKGLCMPAMCIRFWPGWIWLKKAVKEHTYGKVLAAKFRRVAQHPGGAFYSSGAMSGGAILDLHIHDSDFIQYLFGMPKAVSSVGYSSVTNEVDHVVTQYFYDDVPMVMAQGFGFSMSYTVNFENATAVYSFDGKDHIKLIRAGHEPESVKLPEGLGYEHEIAYFLDCVAHNRAPRVVTLMDAYNSIRLVEAESKSVRSHQRVNL